MSYEGVTKVLCDNGHLSVFDAYDTPRMTSWRCKHCGEGSAWEAHVDQTNGPDDTGLCPGDVKLRVRKLHECKCGWCGHKHSKEPVQYFIPAARGKAPRQLRRRQPVNPCKHKRRTMDGGYPDCGEPAI